MSILGVLSLSFDEDPLGAFLDVECRLPLGVFVSENPGGAIVVDSLWEFSCCRSQLLLEVLLLLNVEDPQKGFERAFNMHQTFIRHI